MIPSTSPPSDILKSVMALKCVRSHCIHICSTTAVKNKTGTSQVDTPLETQEAQSFQEILRTFMKNLKVSEHQKCAFCARETLQKFGYSVLGQMEALFKTSASSLVKCYLLWIQRQKIGYRVNFCLLFSEIQLTSGIMSKIRM